MNPDNQRIGLLCGTICFAVANLQAGEIQAQDALPRIPPIAAHDTLRTFQLEPGFQLELLASEPMVVDPVAMVYDENGRAFVAEMRDYPFVQKSNDKPFQENTTDEPLGQIRLLEDIDGNGTFDRSTVFADQLSWPTGLALWNGGLYVVATPDLWYLKDTDGDGVADLRRRVYSGFRKYNIQTVINNLKWGPDNKLYGAGSSNGGKIHMGDSSSKGPLVMGTCDFRFDPRDEENSLEWLSGGARFGNDFDDVGNRFICNIRNPIQHPVMPRTSQGRNPFVTSVPAIHDVAKSGDIVPVFRTSPPEPWRVLNAKRLANDVRSVSPRSESNATGYITSACGLTIYRGDAFPMEYYGTAFLGEVAGNLVHHQRMTRESVTFSSVRSHPTREFLTSTDNWFRPVNFVNAPDGTLHILDMYRETIEHPWSIPDDIKDRLDLRSGDDRGRIYRLAPANFKSARAKPQLQSAESLQLVALLEHPSVWWRETAHRLLLERNDRSVAHHLKVRLADRKPSSSKPDLNALSRMHALWLLLGMGELTDDLLLQAMHDPSPDVQEHAIRLCDSRLESSTILRTAISDKALESSDERLLFQIALVVGNCSLSDRNWLQIKSQILSAIATRFPEDPWLRSAVLSAAVGVALPLLEQRMGKSLERGATLADRVWLYDLAATLGGTADNDQILDALRSVVRLTPGQDNKSYLGMEVLRGLGDGLNRSKHTLNEFLDRLRAEEQSLLQNAIDNAISIAKDRKNAVSDRVCAIKLLAHANDPLLPTTMADFLVAGELDEVQLAAIQWLTLKRSPDTAKLLIQSMRQLSSRARAEAIESLISRREWHSPLLAAIEQKIIRTGEIPSLRKNVLLRSSDESIRDRAIAIMQNAIQSRKEVVDRYQLQLESHRSDAVRGQIVYRRECAICHQSSGTDQSLGPNLTSIRHRTRQEVLLHILDPNREVAPNYVAYSILMNDGKTYSGIIVSEDGNSMTLKSGTGSTEIVPRSQIDEIASTGMSLMPIGFEERISVSEMDDLIEFLLNGSITP